MQTDILKFISIVVLTTLAFDSPPHSEINSIIVYSLKCIYCNPGYYPHGLVWYGIMEAIFQFAKDPKSITVAMATINMVVLFAFKDKILFWPYWFASLVTNFVIPQNYPVIWMIALSGFQMSKNLNRIFLPISLITKLPVGAPIADWEFIFKTSLGIITNYQWDYGVLTVLWMLFLGHSFESVRKGAKLTWMRMKHKKS